MRKCVKSRPWNPIIASVFYRAGIIEKWGTGTLNIMDWCRENGNPPPEWKVRAGSVVLTFRPLRDKIAGQPESQPESGVESQPESGVESGVESNMTLQILDLLRTDVLSKKEIALKLGKARPTRYLNELIRRLVEQGIVEYTVPEKPNSRLQKYRLVK